jgi:hypothetical protein
LSTLPFWFTHIGMPAARLSPNPRDGLSLTWFEALLRYIRKSGNR